MFFFKDFPKTLNRPFFPFEYLTTVTKNLVIANISIAENRFNTFVPYISFNFRREYIYSGRKIYHR